MIKIAATGPKNCIWTALGREKVAGRIVLFNPAWEGYGQTVIYRSAGASKAAELGAVAVLVRSMTGNSLSTPHTGAMNYDELQPKIPAAALSSPRLAPGTSRSSIVHPIVVFVGIVLSSFLDINLER